MSAQTIKLTIPPSIHKDALTVAGATPDARATVERVLQEDREKYHCFFGPVPFHNHTSHHLLAVYDLGASAARLEEIYNNDAQDTIPIFTSNRHLKQVEPQSLIITRENWVDYLGEKNERYYANWLQFFESEAKRLGAREAYEHYIFSAEANEKGVSMVERFVGGAYHPLIQMGYAIEFNSDAMIPQALAQTAVHDAWYPELYPWNAPNDNIEAPSRASPLFEVLNEGYSNGAIQAGPYDAKDFFITRINKSLTPERASAIRRLIVQWVPSVVTNATMSAQEVREKVRDLSFAATLILAGTGRAGHPPRIDFFLMHVLTSSHFIPYLSKKLERPKSLARLLASYLGVLVSLLLSVGAPKLDVALLKSYTDNPHKVGDKQVEHGNVWSGMLPHVIRTHEIHVPKAFRTLLAASQRYGAISKGTVPGAPEVDGTVFVRAAGVLMDVFDWIPADGCERGGQQWDRSGLGWDEAWA